MSQDGNAGSSLIALATAGEARNRPPFVQLKAIESLGRLRNTEAISVLRTIAETKKMFGYSQHRELRIAAIQSLSKIDPRYGTQALAESGLEAAELAIAPLDSGPGCPGSASAATNASSCSIRSRPCCRVPGANRTSSCGK